MCIGYIFAGLRYADQSIRNVIIFAVWNDYDLIEIN